MKMVNVSWKEVTHRIAKAKGKIQVSPKTLLSIRNGRIEKGDVLATAKIAGIMGAKGTGRFIPLCHPLMITGVEISFNLDSEKSCIEIEAEVQTWDRTGVEMEALTAVSIAALTIYDMCKGIDKEMVISDIHLVEKRGGGGERSHFL
jgi:cyclic pyranopterin phosphate synthase